MKLIFRLASVLAVTSAIACQTPRIEPVHTVPLRPQANEPLKVDHLVVVVDSSGSIDRMDLFPGHKAVVEAFVRTLPDGSYQASEVAFGGYDRQIVPHAPFDREAMVAGAASLEFLDEATQLDRVLLEAREMLQGKPGTAAVVIFSDGRPTAPGGWRPVPAETLDAARTLVASREAATCFFTVQTAGDKDGAAFLEKLSQVTPCGAHRRSESLDNIAALHAFTRKVFLGDQLPDVAAVASLADSDGDGVTDAEDACPGTPLGAEVFSDGCWVPPTLYFSFGRAELQRGFASQVDAVYKVLSRNPDMKVRIDGYTDSAGTRAFNRALSARRARAAGRELERRGIAPDRVLVRDLGEEGSPYPNDTPENRAANRRVEFVFSR